jgi:outer membrane protein assembly factor BamA
MRKLVFPLSLAACLASAQAQKFPIHKLNSTGQTRLTEAAVVSATVLKTGQLAGPDEMSQACGKIVNSGFFESCNFRYDPLTVKGVAGFALQFQVTEPNATQNAILDIPGLDENSLWTELASFDPLLERRIPSTEPATLHYIRSIEKFLQSKGKPTRLSHSLESDLDGKGEQMVVVIHPADRPKLASGRFQGNALIPSARLMAAIAPAIRDLDYSGRTLQVILERNLRPIYEEAGHLQSKYTNADVQIMNGNGSATVLINITEGPLHTLGKVELSGDGLDLASLQKAAAFQTGKPANWRLFEEATARISKLFQADGFLAPSLQTERLFTGDVVDAKIRIRKGRQFFFQQLSLRGVNAEQQKAAEKLWKLQPGAPMKSPYVDEFLKELLKNSRFEGIKGFTTRMEVAGAEKNQVELMIEFR